MTDLLLASASPRRKELLQQIAVNFITIAMYIDERALPQEDSVSFVQRLAQEKACAALPKAMAYLY